MYSAKTHKPKTARLPFVQTVTKNQQANAVKGMKCKMGMCTYRSTSPMRMQSIITCGQLQRFHCIVHPNKIRHNPNRFMTCWGNWAADDNINYHLWRALSIVLCPIETRKPLYYQPPASIRHTILTLIKVSIPTTVETHYDRQLKKTVIW